MKIMTNKIHNVLLCLAVLSTSFFSSCDETMDGDTSLTFPSQTSVEGVSPGDTVFVTFTTDVNWQLSSDAMWCKVDGSFLDTSGKAGDQSVAFVISDEAHTVDAAQANISLRLGDETRVITIITRKGITDAVVMGCDSINYSHGQTLVIGTGGTQSLVLRKTTFDSNNLYVSSNAEWFEISREDSVYTLTVKEEYLKYSQYSTTDSICFSDRDKPMMRLNVQYTGMDARNVVLTPETQWDILVSVDGTTYKDAMYEMSGDVYDAPFTSAVATLNDAYVLYYAVYDKELGCTLIDTNSEQWFAVHDDEKGNISVSFEPNEGSQRTAYVFVFPQFVNDSLVATGGDAVADFLFEEKEGKSEIKEDWEYNQYLIAEFIQENALAGYFSIQKGSPLTDIDFVRETDEQWISFANSLGVPTDQIFRTKLEDWISYNINPKLPIETWKPDVPDGAHIELWSKSRTQFEEYYYKAEPAMTEDDLYFYMQFKLVWFEEDAFYGEDYIIYFVDDQGRYLKALVVEPILSVFD